MEHRSTGFVGERHTVEFEGTLDGWEIDCVGFLDDRGLGAEQLAQLHDRSSTLLVAVVELHQCLDRRKERGEEQEECCHLAHGDSAARCHRAADRKQRCLGADPDHFGTRGVGRVGATGGDLGVAMATHLPAVVHEVAGSSVVGGDDPDTGQRLLQVGKEVGDAIPHPQITDRRDVPEPETQRKRRWQGDGQCDDGEEWVVDEQGNGDHRKGEDLHEQVDDALLEQDGQCLDVGRHSSEQDTGLLVGVPVESLALHVAEHAQSQLLVEGLAETAGERDPCPPKSGRHDDGTDIDECHGDDHASITSTHTVVDADLGQDRSQLQGNGFDENE